MYNNQAETRAEAVLALLNNNKDTISTCWEDVGFFWNNEPICEFSTQLRSIYI